MRIAHHRRVFAVAVTTAVGMLTLIGTPAHAQPSSPAAPSLSNSDTTELAQLAEGYLQQRADMLTTTRPTARAAVARVQATRAMTARVQDDLAALAEKGRRYKEVDGGYTKAEVEVKVTDTSVTDRSATLQLTEHTRLHLPFTPQEVEDGAPEYEELSLAHTVTFAQGADGAWLLSSDKADTEGGPTPTTQVSDMDVDASTDDGAGKPDEDEGSKGPGAGTDPLPDGSVDSVVKPSASASYNCSRQDGCIFHRLTGGHATARSRGNPCQVTIPLG